MNAKVKGSRAEHRSMGLLEAAGYSCKNPHPDDKVVSILAQ